MIVVLMNQGVVEKEQSISEFKKENSISSEINQQFIVNFFEANGYNLEELQDERVVFSKDGTTNVLQPNKYYIGDKDGYIAIYKSDVNGIPVIENEDDITQREVSLLMEIDQNMIRNYEMVFDTKEECEEALSNFIS